MYLEVHIRRLYHLDISQEQGNKLKLPKYKIPLLKSHWGLAGNIESEKAARDPANQIVHEFVKVNMATFVNDESFDFDAPLAESKIRPLSLCCCQMHTQELKC